jgi:CheY-like chemotaxis protein
MIRKIFMVDDDAEDQEIFQRVIGDIDSEIEVSFYNNGAVALDHIGAKGRPDLIFLDCLMPVMDGIECLTKLKANRSTRQIPVIMYTSSQNHKENELAIRLGAFQLIQKTNQLEKLSRDIGEVVALLNKAALN